MQELVILDLDGVIINGQSQKFFLDYLFKNKIVGSVFYSRIIFWFFLYKIGLVKNPQKIMKVAYAFVGGREVKYIDKIVEDFFYRQLKKFIFPEIIGIINKHKQKNRELLIVSNSVDLLVKKIADFLAVKNYICTKLDILDGKFTGKISREIVYGKNKVRLINDFVKNRGLDFKNSFAYTDHISDLPLLIMADNPFAVNPDHWLLKEAKKNNWKVLKFKNIK